MRSNSFFFWGGACLVVVALLFVLITILTLTLLPSIEDLYPTTPLTGTGLASLARQAALARVTFGIGILSDLFLIPGIVALYAALEGRARGTMIVASLFMGLYVILDLSVTGTNVVALVSVSEDYASGSATVQQSSLAIAAYIKDVISLSLPISSAALSVGILIISVVLRNWRFGKGVAYLGVGSGIVGLVYGLGAVVPALTGFQGPSAFLELAWFAAMGWKLMRSTPMC